MLCINGQTKLLKTCGPLRYDMQFHNSSIKISPHQLFTREEPPWPLWYFQSIGSLVYSLDKALYDEHKLGIGKPHSWQGIYVGASSYHTIHVPLIYDPSMTHVSPNFMLSLMNTFASLALHCRNFG